MATLEKIRSKQVFLFVVIIGALLAFILGDFFTSGRSLFGNPTTIAKAGDIKIDYNEYQKAVNEASQAQQAQGRHSDSDELAQQAIQQLMFEALVQKQIDELGINVTNAEISRAMTGENPHPAAQQFIYTAAQYLGLPTANGATVLDAMKNPTRYNFTAEQLDMLAQQVFNAPTFAAAWAQQESNIEKTISQQAVGRLVSGLFTANNLDAKGMYNDNIAVRNVSYVSAPLSSVADNEVEATDADIKAKYNEQKGAYKLMEPTRLVDYVVVDIAPSQADYAAAEDEVSKVYEGLLASEGLEALSSNAKFTRDIVAAPVSKLKENAATRNIADSALTTGKVFSLPRINNTYTLAKVLNVAPEVDEVEISSVAFPTRAAADSVMSLIAAGATMDTIIAQNPEYAVKPTKFNLVGNAQISDDMKKLFTTKPVGAPFVYADTLRSQGAVIFNISSRQEPVNTAEVAVIKYVVDPSNSTVTDLKTKLNSFLASNSKGEAFTANADSLYRLQHAEITPSSAHIGNLPESRTAVKWAMNAKKNQVSKVFEGRDYYLVVALKDIYEDYRPYTDPNLNETLKQQVIADKKAAKLIEKYNGKAKDLNGYAQLMNTTVQNDSTAAFASPRFGNLGFGESKVQGAAAAAKVGQLYGPVQGNNSVVYLVVNGENVQGRPFDAKQDGAQFMQMFGINNFFMLLLGDNEIENRSLEFIADK